MYASSGDASDIDSDSYVSNSLFDLCVPASYMGDSDKAYPVIVSVHGGGWFYGDKKLYSHYCCHLAQSGFVVVNFNYRLAPQNKYPSAIEDVAHLVKYIDDHARVFGLDMNRFSCWEIRRGHSSLHSIALLRQIRNIGRNWIILPMIKDQPKSA